MLRRHPQTRMSLRQQMLAERPRLRSLALTTMTWTSAALKTSLWETA